VFSNLLESQARANRNAIGQALSVVMHTGAIAFAVLATQEVVTAAAPPVNERVRFVAPPAPPPPPLVAPRDAAPRPPIPLGHQVLIAPISIPDVLPPIDYTRPITDPLDYNRSRGVPGGRHDGAPNAVARPLTSEITYFASEVDKPAAQVAGTGTPEYPEALRAAGIGGEVRAQFIVDTTGRADLASLKFVKSAHAQFNESVRKALSRMLFKPAETGSHKVRQIVEMPFVFSIR
jgi:protein TonB